MRGRPQDFSIEVGRLSRRSAIAILAFVGAGGLAAKAFALQPAGNVEDIWPEITAGDFATAATRLQLYVDDRPADQAARVSLAIMQFGAGMFNPAEENFWRIVKLERSYAEVEGSRLDLQHTEAWLYLSRLRLGRSDKAAEPKSTNSLLYLLSGQISAEDFAAALTDAYFAQLDQLAASLPAPAVVKTQDGQSVTIGTRIERPARDVEPMHAVVAQIAGTVVEKPSPVAMETNRIERSLGGWSEPHVVVDSRRNRCVGRPPDRSLPRALPGLREADSS